jgi:hypothetical protein
MSASDYEVPYVSSRRMQKKVKPVDPRAVRESLIARCRNENDPAMRAVLWTEICAADRVIENQK